MLSISNNCKLCRYIKLEIKIGVYLCSKFLVEKYLCWKFWGENLKWVRKIERQMDRYTNR